MSRAFAGPIDSGGGYDPVDAARLLGHYAVLFEASYHGGFIEWTLVRSR